MPDGGATEIVATDLFATAAADDAAFGATALGTGADLSAAGVDLGTAAAATADAAGVAIGSSIADSGSAVAEGAGTVDAGTAEATRSLAGPATTSIAADTAPSATQSLAQQTLESGVPNSAVDGSGFTGDVGSQGMTTDQLAQTGAGAATAPAASNGIVDKIMKLDPRVQAGILQGVGTAAAGAAVGAGNVLAKKEEAELALKNKEAYQDWLRGFIQSGSQGGAGTTLGFSAAPGGVLTRPGGAPVFGSNGLIGSRV